MAGELKISAYGLSSTGKELNLDNMYINGRYVNVGSDTQSAINKLTTENFQVYGVSDSEIGSAPDKELSVASGYTVMNMLQRTQASLRSAGKIDKPTIWNSLVEANRAIRGKRQEIGIDSLGSSFAALFLHKNRGLAVHLGDSRIYVVRGGRMLQITDDHLESSDMFRLGILSQAQSEVHKQESNLTAYMGMDDIYDARDDAFSKYFIFYPGDTFILCTDGVSDAVLNDQLEEIVRENDAASVNQLGETIMKVAAAKSDADMTIVVLHIDEAEGEAAPAGSRRASAVSEEQAGDVENAQVIERPKKEAPKLSSTAAVSAPAPQEAADEEDEGEEPSLLDRLKSALPAGLFGARKAAESDDSDDEADDADTAYDNQAAQPARTAGSAPSRRSSDNFDDYEDEPMDDEEGASSSLLDTLLQDPKRLAIIAGCVIAAIILLVIITSGSKNKKTTDNSSQASTEASAETSSETSSQATSDNSSFTTVTIDTSLPIDFNSSEESSEESSGGGQNLTEPVDYTVVEGDTLYGILYSLYGYYDDELLYAFCDYNNMSIYDYISVGDVLTAPPLDELLSGTATNDNASTDSVEFESEESTETSEAEESTTGE